MNRMSKAFALAVAALFLAGAAATSQDLPKAQRKTITPAARQVRVTNMGQQLNSYADDFAPVMMGNGKVMYFTSGRSGAQDIFSAVSQGGSWSEPLALGSGVNTGDPEGGVSITPDGHWMVFAGCDRDDSYGDCDLYMAEYLGGAWRNITNLGAVVNSESWDSQPSISPDGLTIYFASNRPGGQGGTDIWMTTRNFGGEWQEPKNMGFAVNTIGNEASPYISIDNKTFFFSSDYHPGIGGMDMYVAKRSGNTWSTPENAGTPLNSEKDDYFYSLQWGSDNIFFASDRDGGQGGMDIYVGVPNPFQPSAVTAVNGKVTDATSGTPLGAVITVSDIVTNEPIASFYSDDMDGSYTVVLQPGKSYAVTAQAPGYLFYSDRVDVPVDAPNNTLRKDIKMSKELTRLLVYFDFDKAVLQRESNVDLDNAAKWLKANPDLRVELSGHTDNVGTQEYNLKLSSDRASAVKEYLVRKGVDGTRIVAKGYGMEQPVANNDTEEGRARNRRVEFRVIAK